MTMSMNDGAIEKRFRYENEDLVIDKETDLVMYNDAKHVYVGKCGDSEGKKFTSVTTLIGMYENKFDPEFWKRYKALESLLSAQEFKPIKAKLLDTKKWDDGYLNGINVESFNLKCQEFVDAWAVENKKACDWGTKIHAIQEMGFYDNPDSMFFKFSLGGKIDIHKNHHTFDVENGIFPEMLLSFVDKDGIVRIAGQSDLVIKRGNKIQIWDWKGLPLDTPIATKSGWSTMGDLKEGDEVFDKDGNVTKVVHKSKVHHNPCFKITFDNAESIIADHEHKWLVSYKHSKTKWVDKIMTTEDLFDEMSEIEFMRSNGEKINSKILPKIRNAKPLNLPKVNLPIDPYVFGCWLGDGSKSCGMLTNINEGIWNEIRSRGYEVGNDVSAEGRAESRTILGIRKELVELGVLNNKHIPDIYMRASYSQRLDLLRGMMDTDGYYHKERKRFVMGTGQVWQAEDTEKLVASLGMKPTTFKVVKKCDGKSYDGWDVCFSSMEINPFLVRNQEVEIPTTDKCSFRSIKSVEKVETIPTQCIEVDSPTHTFLAGHTLIVTHNTNKKLEQESYYDRKKKSHVMMKYPLNNIMDVNFWHYTLQLSLYGYIIEYNNPELEIEALKIVHFTHDGDEVEYDLEYRKDDVIRLLKHYKKQLLIQQFNDARKPVIYE